MLIFYKGGDILNYDDQENGSVNKGIAIANNGLSVCNFVIGSRSAVKILNIGNVVSINNGGVKVGALGFGSGLSISQSENEQNIAIDQKVAIGDPVAGRVSIFSITSSGVFSSTSSDIYAPSGMELTGFGEKVGLSAAGNSLAVAAPRYLGDSEEIGCVLLYLYDSALSQWELVDSLIYGNVNNLRLGQGGVAVEDLSGRLDANDSAGERFSYLVCLPVKIQFFFDPVTCTHIIFLYLKYNTLCSDPYAVSLAKTNNIFDPTCECGKDKKSSNADYGGKALRNSRDVCVSCESLEGFGDCKRGPDGPTAAPTTAPLTARPTVITPAPSSNPTVITESPSSAPSWSPASLYDGDACGFDAECKTGVCENGRCKAEVGTHSSTHMYFLHTILQNHRLFSFLGFQYYLRRWRHSSHA